MAVKVEWFEGYGGRGEAIPSLRGPVVVARSRTTITECGVLDLPAGPVPVHRKVYRYNGIGALLSGAFRTTFAAPSRARREAGALVRLAALGLAPHPVALAEDRIAGFLREAVLFVRTVEGGVNLAEAPSSPALAAAVGRAAGTIHAAGLGDLSLAPRNLVVAGDTVMKVDSGQLREVPRGGSIQAADLADLLAGLEGRWTAEDLDGLRTAYAAAAGRIPEGLDGAMAAARVRAARRVRNPPPP
jgi:tRNA A-37 threonylcarbamoyl transferase component Bud32